MIVGYKKCILLMEEGGVFLFILLLGKMLEFHVFIYLRKRNSLPVGIEWC